MAFSIGDIKGHLKLGGARPSLFEVILTTPGGVDGVNSFQYMCRAAQMPASTLGMIEVPYFGRKIKIAGDRTFAEWTVTVIQDEDMSIRNSMEQWSNKINTHVGNKRVFGANANEYKSNATVTHFGKTGNRIRSYTFNGLFPTEISPIDLDWNTTHTLEEFTVTFQYDHWEVNGATAKNINHQVGGANFGAFTL